MSGKSLKVNSILNGMRTMLSIIFPLITLPYATRVLQVVNFGKVNFSNSIISYFTLIAALGISTYAIREGSGVRNDTKKFNEFASQVFTINIISNIIAYSGLFLSMLLIPKLGDYRILLYIQSISMIFTTLGVEWVYSIYEDYVYITVRSLIFQFVSMILLFVLVKDPGDYYLYAGITVFSSVGSNVLNFMNLKKYCKIKLTKNLNLKKHSKAILIIFSTSIATTIYVNSDTTMLGLMVGDYSVGLYSVSVKVYLIMKTFLAAVIIVALPRLSFYIATKEKKKYNFTLTKIFNSLSLLILPIVLGINLICNQIIIIIAGNSYIEANTSLRILSIALIFSAFATFTTTSILLPMRKEKYILQATIVSAVVNIGLNLFLIPLLQQNATAVTTAIAEFIVLSITYYHARRYVKLHGVVKNFITSIIGCVGIFLLSIFLKILFTDMMVYTVTTVVCSVITYYVILLLLRNELTWELTNALKSKLTFKKRLS